MTMQLAPAWISLTVSCVSRAILIMSDFTSAIWDVRCLIPGPSKHFRDSSAASRYSCPATSWACVLGNPSMKSSSHIIHLGCFLLVAGTDTSSVVCHNAAIPTHASRNYLVLSPSLRNYATYVALCCSGRFKSCPVVRDAGSVLDQGDWWSPRRRLDQPA